jgi:HEPN domain-containing protein
MELEYVAEWFKYADSDLASAVYLQGLQPRPLEIICYHCEQSAEKFLKGYIIYKESVDPPKIHNLDTLCEMCAKHDERFENIKRTCNVLTAYGVQSRYPYEMTITEPEMIKALEYARQIRDTDPLMEIRKEIKNSNKGAK